MVLIINSLSLLFRTQGRPSKKQGTLRRLYPRGPRRALLGLIAHFSLILINPQRTRGRTRKGMKFWVEKLIINLAEDLDFILFFFEDLDFRGTGFLSSQFMV